MNVLDGNAVRELFEHVANLLFEVTESCNFNCAYCGYGKNYVQPELRPLNSRRFMSWETAKALLDTFLPLWKKYGKVRRHVIISFYGGEPLLNFPLIRKVVEYVDDNKPEAYEIQYYMTTNGYFLRKHISFLVEHNFTVGVSLDGDRRADSYRQFHNGKETFPSVRENLDYVRQAYPDFFEKNLSFLSVLNNRATYFDVLDFFKKEFDKTPDVSNLSEANLAEGSRIPEYMRTVENDLETLYSDNPEKFAEYGIASPEKRKLTDCLKRVLPVYRTYLDFFQGEDYRSYTKHTCSETCPPFKSRLFMTTAGYIFPCEKVDFRFPLGRVADGAVRLDFEKIADLYNVMYSTAERLCGHCLNRNDCKHCFISAGELSADGVHRCPDFLPDTPATVKKQMDYIISHNEILFT